MFQTKKTGNEEESFKIRFNLGRFSVLDFAPGLEIILLPSK
jgi:hypothetical protein